jgi:hypothetical protein
LGLYLSIVGSYALKYEIISNASPTINKANARRAYGQSKNNKMMTGPITASNSPRLNISKIVVRFVSTSFILSLLINKEWKRLQLKKRPNLTASLPILITPCSNE